MGRVFLARMRGTHGFEREVALKLMHPHLSDDPVAAATFLAEARLLGRIRHPNVVSALDVGEHELGVYIALDYVEGDSLAGLLKQARKRGLKIPLPIGLRILVDSLSGLHAAHELRDGTGTLVGLVHRDFTPHNLLVGLDGVARLTDFGIAKLAHTTHSHSGSVKGKLKYLAPEQIHAQSVDRRTDIFTAGVVAWELSAGQHMIQGENDGEIMVKLVRGERPRLTEVVPDAPQDLDDVLVRAVSTNASSRQQTALELKNDLLDLSTKAAEHAEVAEWVERLVGEDLAERRRLLEELLSQTPTDTRYTQRAHPPPRAPVSSKKTIEDEDTFVDSGGPDAIPPIPAQAAPVDDDEETPSGPDDVIPGEATLAGRLPDEEPPDEATLAGVRRSDVMPVEEGVGETTLLLVRPGETTLQLPKVGETTLRLAPEGPSPVHAIEDAPTPPPVHVEPPPPSAPPPSTPPPSPPRSVAPVAANGFAPIQVPPSTPLVEDLEDFSMPAPRRTIGRTAVLAGAALVIVAVGIGLLAMSSGPPQEKTPPAASAPRDPPRRVDVNEGASLTISSDVPLKQVSIGGKVIVLDPPLRDARVPLADPSRAVDVALFAASGAEKTVRAEAGQKNVEVRFVEVKPPPSVWQPRQPPSAWQKGGRTPVTPTPLRP